MTSAILLHDGLRSGSIAVAQIAIRINPPAFIPADRHPDHHLGILAATFDEPRPHGDNIEARETVRVDVLDGLREAARKSEVVEFHANSQINKHVTITDAAIPHAR
jgi:hypothetical protein